MDARIFRAGVLGGLCGALLIDLYLIVTETYLIHNATPLLVMQWDASNALGMAAYSGGWSTAILGTGMHFTVSACWGLLFAAVAARSRWVLDHPLLSGILLGVIAMGVMRAVIHLGHAIVHPFPNFWYFLNLFIAHEVFFGIPVAFATNALLRQHRVAVSS
ncbi:MAG TPA: hypothetical protein VGX91_05470 [Candidatus Cybelea sp.]|jgi:hypothetical protein|nr:hypothetical protein [Candidatus Cybelea sp.]